MIGVLAERLAHLLDREIHALLEIHERVARPQRRPYLFAGDNAAGLAGQQAQQSEWLRL